MANKVMLALHHATQTTARVWVRSTTAGALSLSCSAGTFSGGTVDPSIEDGCGLVTVTGLQPGTSYPFVVSVAGAQVASGTLRTMPADGSTFTIGFGTCPDYVRDALPLRTLIRDPLHAAGRVVRG